MIVIEPCQFINYRPCTVEETIKASLNWKRKELLVFIWANFHFKFSVVTKGCPKSPSRIIGMKKNFMQFPIICPKEGLISKLALQLSSTLLIYASQPSYPSLVIYHSQGRNQDAQLTKRERMFSHFPKPIVERLPKLLKEAKMQSQPVLDPPLHS